MNVLELFAGIGGLSLGLQRAGMRIIGHVELNPFCRAILHKHWPEVPSHDDVRTAVAWWTGAVRPPVHVIAGGYPCQPDSIAGKRAGTEDERWLWPAMARVVHSLKPRWVIGENVDGHRSGGLRFVLRDLERLGYSPTVGTIRACEVGAPHARARVFVVAYTNSLDGTPRLGGGQQGKQAQILGHDGRTRSWADPTDWVLAATSPDRGMADGIPAGLDAARVTALGNAVVPQVGEHIGRIVIAAERESSLEAVR